MQFNEKLKELRLKKGISQTELAEKIFVSRSAVAKWENGLGLPSEASLNLLAEFFSVNKEDLYSDGETENVIVKKNIAISKSRKLLIIIGAVCLIIVIAFIVTVAAMVSSSRDKPIGGDTGKMVGVWGTIFDDENSFNDRLLNKQTPYNNDYILEVGKTYFLEIGARQSGGSRELGLNSDDITFLYDNDIFNIELISENGEPVFGVPRYSLTVKAKCQFSSVVIGSNSFYESLIISAIEV